jgi:ribosome modulation factor
MRLLNNPPWEKGYNAYTLSIKRDDNPYPEDSEDFELWLEGWNCADSDYDDE